MEGAELEELKKAILAAEGQALNDSLAYIRAHGEAHVGELRREVQATRGITVARLREMLNVLAVDGILGTEVRMPPYANDPKARVQRRYYWHRRR